MDFVNLSKTIMNPLNQRWKKPWKSSTALQEILKSINQGKTVKILIILETKMKLCQETKKSKEEIPEINAALKEDKEEITPTKRIPNQENYQSQKLPLKVKNEMIN